jgi:hypothetical protein
MSASSSSSDAPGPSSANAKIEKLEAKRDRVEAERELVKDLLKVKEGERSNFIDNNPDYEGLREYQIGGLLIRERERLDQQESRLSAEIHDLRSSSGNYPHFYCHAFTFFISYIYVCFWLLGLTIIPHPYLFHYEAPI